MMGNHMAGGRFIYFKPKRTVSDFLKSGLYVTFVLMQCLGITHSQGLCIVLSLTEATVIAPHEDLHLFASSSASTKHVQIRITGEPIKRGLILLTITYGTTHAQIERNGSGHWKTATDRRINCSIESSRPTAARQSSHVENAIAWKVIGMGALLEII